VNRTTRNLIVVAALGGGTLALPGLAAGAVTGSGSSFAATAWTKWCQDSGLCSYTSKGSTGGINDLINGVVDYAGSDATLSSQQLSDLSSKRGGVKPLYFPVLIGALTVDTNIDGVSKGINIDGPVLADIFRGAITNWSDARIRKPNPGVKFPNAPITVCVRSDGSGTSFTFTSYLSKVSRDFRNQIGATQQPNWPSNVVKGPRNPGVASCVKSNSNSIGYVDISDARDAGLTKNFARIGHSETVKVNGKRKRVTKYILPSAGSAAKAGNLKTFPKDLAISLTASPAPGADPITAVSWAIVYSNAAAAGKSSGSRDGVKKLLGYVYSSNGQKTLNDLRFTPLPPALLAASKAQLKLVK
jgi:phosphate transport system substrate-binding protein